MMLLRLLEHKFGAVDDETRACVLAADTDRLLKWGERVLSASTLAEVFL